MHVSIMFPSMWLEITIGLFHYSSTWNVAFCYVSGALFRGFRFRPEGDRNVNVAGLLKQFLWVCVKTVGKDNVKMEKKLHTRPLEPHLSDVRAIEVLQLRACATQTLQNSVDLLIDCKRWHWYTNNMKYLALTARTSCTEWFVHFF